jgi:NADPH:quinone reductase-like Zn-dependent oxidoreductase
MRYHEYGGPECLRDDVVERPNPAEDEVLVELAATSVNPADWQLGAGYAQSLFDLPMPFTRGMDFAGIVREVGSVVAPLPSAIASSGLRYLLGVGATRNT